MTEKNLIIQTDDNLLYRNDLSINLASDYWEKINIKYRLLDREMEKLRFQERVYIPTWRIIGTFFYNYINIP